jgi:hypothetical protein
MFRAEHQFILILLTLGALVAPLSAYGQSLHLSDLVTASDYIVVGRIWQFSSKDGIRSVSLNVSKTIRGRRYPILNVVEVPPDTSEVPVWELKAIYFLAEYHPNADTSQSADPYELRLLDRSVNVILHTCADTVCFWQIFSLRTS